MRRPTSFLLSALLGSTLLACSGEPAGPQGNAPGVARGATDLDVSAAGKLVARVGNGGVTEEEFVERAIRSPGAASGALTADAQKEVLDRLVTEEALWQEAMAHELYRDPKVRKIMVNLLLREEIYANVTAGDFAPEQLKDYFDEHREEFVVPEKVQVKRIFLRIGPDRDSAAAIELAAKLRQEIVAQPGEFKRLAIEHSDGPYKRRGGDLGFLSAEGKPGIDKSVVDEAFKLEVGQISQPFQAAGGMNLVTVTSKRERVERTFEQMKGSVLRKLKNEKYKELTDTYVSSIKDRFTVTIDEEALKAIDLDAARADRMGSPDRPEEEGLLDDGPSDEELELDH